MENTLVFLAYNKVFLLYEVYVKTIQILFNIFYIKKKLKMYFWIFGSQYSSKNNNNPYSLL